MYSQNQNVFMNGGGHGPHRFGMPMGASKPFNPGQHVQPHHRQQQDHNGYSNHAHNTSTGGFSSATPVFNPAHMRNGTPSSIQNGLNRDTTPHWQQQLALAEQSRAMTGTHPHARNQSNRQGPQTALEQARQHAEQEEKRKGALQPSENGISSWLELDLGGQGLRALSPALFTFPFLKKLHLNNNRLASLDPAIGKLRSLTHFDLSQNRLTSLPAELGMLVNLKSLLLFDNYLEELPAELGFLYQLEVLGIEGNPSLDPNARSVVEQEGTRGLVSTLQESADAPEPPNDRDWIVVDESRTSAEVSPADKLTVVSYNTLCDRAASSAIYGYTSPNHLAWDHRKQLILSECRSRNPDILCLQEVAQDAYNEYFRPELAVNGYKGAFWPKARARTMTQQEAQIVDGCATMYKDKKYMLLDKQTVDFANAAINRPDMKTEADIFNRVMPRDHVALVTFLENRMTGARLIVVNAHLEWNPMFRDVKVVQIAILMEQVGRLAEQYAKWPAEKNKKVYRYTEGDDEESASEQAEPAPSQEYASGPQIPLLLCIDANSTPDSGVYTLLDQSNLPRDHADLGEFRYGKFTREGMAHPFSLKSAYDTRDLPFTNYTPGFQGMIDYIWYSSNALQVTGLLGEVDRSYLQRVPGFPNVHFPSDHLALMAEFVFRQQRRTGGTGGGGGGGGR